MYVYIDWSSIIIINKIVLDFKIRRKYFFKKFSHSGANLTKIIYIRFLLCLFLSSFNQIQKEFQAILYVAFAHNWSIDIISVFVQPWLVQVIPRLLLYKKPRICLNNQLE